MEISWSFEWPCEKASERKHFEGTTFVFLLCYLYELLLNCLKCRNPILRNSKAEVKNQQVRWLFALQVVKSLSPSVIFWYRKCWAGLHFTTFTLNLYIPYHRPQHTHTHHLPWLNPSLMHDITHMWPTQDRPPTSALPTRCRIVASPSSCDFFHCTHHSLLPLSIQLSYPWEATFSNILFMSVFPQPIGIFDH